eukprot:COSAG05_NODE_559_length_8689_cov_212.699418_7_plen_103_part_00
MHDENTRCCVSQEMLHGPQNHAENKGGTAGKTRNVYRPVETPITLPEPARLESLLRRQLVRIGTSISDGISRRDRIVMEPSEWGGSLGATASMQWINKLRHT